MKNKKLIVGVVVVLLVVGLGIKGKGLLEDRKAEIALTPLPKDMSHAVRVVRAQEGQIEKKVSFLAQVFSDKSIKLSTKLAGFVEKVWVRESQIVKKGDLLVSIDDAELRSSLDALSSTLKAQKSDLGIVQSVFSRNQKLYAVGGISKEALDMSAVSVVGKQSLIENSRQKISQLKHQKSYLQIVAPFDGEIDAMFLHEGDLAAAGKPILAMSNGEKKLVFSYAPRLAQTIHAAQVVLWEGKNIGAVNALYTQSTNGLLRAEVSLDEKVDLPVGSSMNIEIVLGESQGCVVPENTLLHKKDGIFVMEYRDLSFHALEIEVLAQGNGSIMISPCPSYPIAKAGEVKLAQLPVFKNVLVSGVEDE